MNFLTVLVVLLQTFGSVKCLNSKSSTFGKDFYFGILPVLHGYIHSPGNKVTIDVTNVSPQDIQIRLQIPYFQNDSYYYIETGKSKTFYVPPQLQRGETFKDSRGIRITSDGDASVIVSTRFNSSNAMDVYNALPTTSIGKRYIIASYRGSTEYMGSMFLAAGVSNNTNLTVYVNGTSHSVLLNALDVYQLLCKFGGGGSLCDLSGALLVSDKDIAVIAGSSWSTSLIQTYDEDILSSEMFPTSTWTTSYIIPPLYPQPRFSFRVMSEYDTIIMFSNTTQLFSSKADLREMCFEKLPVLAFANKTFSVSQYGVSNNYIHGDIFIAAVPGIDQYINNYVFTVPQAFYGNTTSHIALIVPLKMKDTLMLDGQSVKARATSVGDITQLSVPPPFDNYTVLTFQTTEGIHHFWHPQSDVTFGVFVYGLGYRMGYGFYAGYYLPGKEGKEETTVQMATTTATSTPTVDMGRMCYKCNDLTHPDLCDTVEKCASNEVCFLKTFTESGRRKFRSGCLRNDVCQANMNNSWLSNELCFECCNVDYCNNKGCGEAGIPERNSRGPICYDCQYVYSPEECHKITSCEQHQVCRIEGSKWFSRTHFKMGCGDMGCMTFIHLLECVLVFI